MAALNDGDLKKLRHHFEDRRPFMGSDEQAIRAIDTARSAIATIADLEAKLVIARMAEDLARALAAEEAARLVENGKEGWCDVSQIARDLRALAPLEPSLCVMTADRKEAVRSFIESIKWDETQSEKELHAKCDAALRALGVAP